MTYYCWQNTALSIQWTLYHLMRPWETICGSEATQLTLIDHNMLMARYKCSTVLSTNNSDTCTILNLFKVAHYQCK